MTELAIKVSGLGKKYKIGSLKQQGGLLSHTIGQIITHPIQQLRDAIYNQNRETIWALKDLNLEVPEKQVVGIIGRNGAGKSTLLKILSRVSEPTEGKIEIRGRTASLLEVGTGFHPELTGRENVFLNGTILGMRRSEIRDKFDEIVAFSGVEKFLDTPIKHYSSGMSMRLAFAVAAHLNPDIFFVDEVLAVGDLEFQRKCLGKMESVVNEGRTILFVSHQINSIRRLCNVCVWIDGGKVVMQGPTQEVIANYEAMSLARPAEEQIVDAKRRHLTRFVKWEVITGGAEEKNWLETMGQVKIRFTLICQKKLNKPLFGIALWDLNEQLIWGNATESFQIDSSGVYEIDVDLPQLPIKPGHYRWHVSLWDTGGKVDEWFAAPDLVVATMPVAHSNQNWAGVLNISSEFSIKQVSD